MVRVRVSAVLRTDPAIPAAAAVGGDTVGDVLAAWRRAHPAAAALWDGAAGLHPWIAVFVDGKDLGSAPASAHGVGPSSEIHLLAQASGG